jgi:hypothetical protein
MAQAMASPAPTAAGLLLNTALAVGLMVLLPSSAKPQQLTTPPSPM